MKDNQIIRVGLFMKKYQKFDIRVGKFDKESKEFISNNGQRCITFFDLYRNRYTTAVNYFLSEVK